MFEEFRSKERTSISESEIYTNLSDRLYQNQLSELEEYGISPLDDYESKAKVLLKKWLEFGFLRNYPNEHGLAFYELTSYSVKVLDWIETIYKKREFVGTESKLLDIFEKPEKIIRLSDPNVEKRLKVLEEEKQQLEDKIVFADRFSRTHLRIPLHRTTIYDYPGIAPALHVLNISLNPLVFFKRPRQQSGMGRAC